MPALASLLAELSTRLQGVSETPLTDLQVACAGTLGVSRTWVLAHPETELSASQAAELEGLAHRLQHGEPLPYILGHWEFFGLEFSVNPAVLIPRPETELLVEEALRWLRTHPPLPSPPTPLPMGEGSPYSLSPRERAGVRESRGVHVAADIGCGSGCIAISLAVNDPDLFVIASDISRPALQVTRGNALIHSATSRVVCMQADLLPSVSCPFDLICANLPYIPDRTLRSLRLAKWEPILALWGGADGLALIRRLLKQIQDRPGSLNPGGLILLEIESSLGTIALELACQAFPEADVHLLPDLAGLDRCISIQT